MLVRFAMAEASAGDQVAQGLRYGTVRVLALTRQCFGALRNNPECGSVLVGMSEAATAAGRRPRTGLVPAWGLVWFLGTTPASQFRAGRAGEGLNQQRSVCHTSQLPSEILVQAGALGHGTWEGTAGAAQGVAAGQPGGVAGRMSSSPCCRGHTCACELPSSDPQT